MSHTPTRSFPLATTENVTIGALLAQLPATSLSLATATARSLTGFAIHEPGSSVQCRPGDVVLGVGIAEPEQAGAFLTAAARGRAHCVVLRSGVAEHPRIRRVSESEDVPVIGIGPQRPWSTVMDAFFRARAQRDDVAEGARTLFDLADAAAAVLGGPVTIEDERSRVLAYSAGQEKVDDARIDTIMGRSVPADIASFYRTRGVYRRLAEGDEPLRIPPGPARTLARLVLPIRDGSRLIGSVWAAVTDLPERLDDDAIARLAQAVRARLLAMHLATASVGRLLTEALTSSLVTADDAAAPYLGDGPWRVVALIDSETPADHTLVRFREHMRAHGWREPLCAEHDGTAYAICRADGTDAGSWPWLVRRMQDRPPGQLRFAAGGPAETCSELSRSRQEADELVAHAGEHPASAFLEFESEWASLVVGRALSGGRLAELASPLQVLRDHDLAYGTDYVVTLDAWLSYPAEHRRAATAIHVHPNTLRYRIRKIAEIVHLDLTDPRQVLALRLQATSMLTA